MNRKVTVRTLPPAALEPAYHRSPRPVVAHRSELGTTMLTSALTPKLPPFKGD